MSIFKGTRGPWVASKSDRSIGPIRKDDDQSYGMIFPVAWVEFDGKREHQEADANLIAAAPELLEALQMALEWIDAVPQDLQLPVMPGFCRDIVDDVIKKALGQ